MKKPEIIESITETFWNSVGSGCFEGIIIKTNKQEIKIGISSDRSCCEDFGGFSTNDDVQSFIGATVLNLKLTDTSLNTEIIKDRFEYGLDCGEIQFVDIETNQGSLQYAVYNSHNGYYGHSIEVVSEQLKHEGML